MVGAQLLIRRLLRPAGWDSSIVFVKKRGGFLKPSVDFASCFPTPSMEQEQSREDYFGMGCLLTTSPNVLANLPPLF